jgi:hypothetical protein
MNVVSRCALRVGSLVWQATDGTFVLTIACKATYLLRPGTSQLAHRSDDVQEANSYWDDDERRSLNAASDLVPFKPKVDVLLTGHAYAPEGKPCQSLLARLVVGKLDKVVEIFGDRSVSPQGRISPPSGFVKMPLRWERAAGGPGTSNPVGIRTGVYSAPALPNLQPPGPLLTTIRGPIEPIGFGPIAPIWPQRSERLGQLVASWDHEGWFRRPLPAGLDGQYFNCAPSDQQIDELAPDARIVLESLHREYPRLSTNLAGVIPRAALERAGRREEIAFRCDTLWIDTDRVMCSVIWRGWAALRSPHEEGLVVVTDDGRPSHHPADVTTTMLAGLDAAGGTPPLPFVPSSSQVALPRPEEPSARAPIPDDGTGTLVAALAPATRALPFDRVPQEPLRTALDPAPVAVVPPERVLVQHPSDDELRETVRPPEAPVPPPLLSLSSPSAVPAKEEPSPPVDPKSVPVERHAAVAATLDHRRSPRGDVLEAEAWSEQDWAAIDQHTAATLAAEAAVGGYTLRSASDAAYVARLEVLRGPIQPAEYARILGGIQSGTSADVLRALDIPGPALMRIVRLWTAKLAREPKLSIDLMKSLTAAREPADNDGAATA